jgi:hypothetical protein
MYALKTYEQSAVFDPTNPHQRIREEYASDPGTWASYYFNEVPTTATLGGLGAGLGASWTSVPGWAQIAIVGAIGAAAGYFGWQRYGEKLKPTLRKLPVIGGQFAGLRGARRRRSKR